MNDNLAARIALAEILKKSLTLKASKPRGIRNPGAAEDCISIWESDVPPRVYIAWKEHEDTIFSFTPPANKAFTTYVVQAEVDALIADRDLWRQSKQFCMRQFTHVQDGFMEALTLLESLIDLGHSKESLGQTIDAVREFLTKHGDQHD